MRSGARSRRLRSCRPRAGTRRQQERLRLASEIEVRDRSSQAELAEYRRLITGAVATPNLQRLAALQRFADAERGQASHALEEIDRIAREARRKAAQRLADLESAKETRERAALAMQMKDQQAAVRVHQGEVPRTGEEHGATRHAVHAEQPVDDAQAIDGSAGMSASAKPERASLSGAGCREASQMSRGRVEFENSDSSSPSDHLTSRCALSCADHP